MNPCKEFDSFIRLLLLESGKVIKNYFRKQVEVSAKIDYSPVTIADQKAEEVMRNLIVKNFPEHGIIGEEFGNHNEDADFVWVLDPIDGTLSYICGAINFGTLIGLLYKNKPILGVFNQPILNEYLIGDNKETRLNGQLVQVSSVSKLSQARLLTTDVFNIKKYQDISNFENLLKQIQYFRCLGDSYGYYLLATGFAEIMIDPILSIWDSIPLIPIIKGAGGVISDYYGRNPLSGEGIVASTSSLHHQVISLLNTTA